jgi:hypothetical protein
MCESEFDTPINIYWRSIQDPIDYKYLIHQCITDSSTIDFGFAFTNGSTAGDCHACFTVHTNGIITGSCGNHGAREIAYTDIEDMVRDTEYASQCAHTEEFSWKRKFSGIPGSMGG